MKSRRKEERRREGEEKEKEKEENEAEGNGLTWNATVALTENHILYD